MTETYLIAITPPAHIQKLVLREKQKYPKFSIYHLPPHITLYHPFESEITLQEITDRLKENLHGNPSFSVYLNTYGSFEGKQNVLFFKPNPETTKLLTTLHNRVKRAIPKTHKEINTPYKTHGTYHPHLTIAQRIPKREFAKVKEGQKPLAKPLTFTCSRVDIYQRNAKSHTYTKVRHILLTKSK